MFSEGEFRVVVEVIDVQGLIWPAPTVAERAAAARGAHRKVGKLPSPFVDVLVGGKIQSLVFDTTVKKQYQRFHLLIF